MLFFNINFLLPMPICTEIREERKNLNISVCPNDASIIHDFIGCAVMDYRNHRVIQPRGLTPFT